eukprot:1468026-Amphidinium_carterae.2
MCTRDVVAILPTSQVSWSESGIRDWAIMKCVAEETFRVSTRRRIEERPDTPTTQADWHTSDYYAWHSDLACTYHSLCFQQSSPTSVAIMCRPCFELQGRQLAPTLFSRAGSHGQASGFGF